MRSILPVLVALSHLAPFASTLRAQVADAETGSRLLELRVEPGRPTFGQPFELHATLRLRPSVVAFLSDTLLPSEDAQSIGPGRWSQRPAAGDSVDLSAVYPAIGFREGRLELPRIELWIRPPGRADPEALATVGDIAAAPAASRALVTPRVLPLGEIDVAPFSDVAEAEGPLVARPAADVLGREWGIWLVLAIVVGFLLAALVGAWTILFLRRAGTTLASHGQPPREIALRELDHLRSLGWHRDGRVQDFYAASTAVLRQFAGRLEPEWGDHLTSYELLVRLEGRWGPSGLESLSPAVSVAERVKFGHHRPDAETAEADWTRIRDWVRGVPED